MSEEKYERLTADKICNDGLLNLLEAFLEELSKEFNYTFLNVLDNPKDKDAQHHYSEIKQYMRSEYFTMLTGLDGNSIISTLENRCLSKGVV